MAHRYREIPVCVPPRAPSHLISSLLNKTHFPNFPKVDPGDVPMQSPRGIRSDPTAAFSDHANRAHSDSVALRSQQSKARFKTSHGGKRSVGGISHRPPRATAGYQRGARLEDEERECPSPPRSPSSRADRAGGTAVERRSGAESREAERRASRANVERRARRRGRRRAERRSSRGRRWNGRRARRSGGRR